MKCLHQIFILMFSVRVGKGCPVHRYLMQKKRSLSSIDSTSESSPDINIWKPDYNKWCDKSIFTHVSSNQWDMLERFSILLYDWNTKINLVSRKDIEFLIPNHILPSISISLVRQFKQNERVIDIGTGGGFPGLPMSIVCPDAKFTLVDSNMKKIMVVKDIAAQLKLPNVDIRRCRAEEINDKYDFLMGRAVADVPTFLGFSAHLLDKDSRVADSVVRDKDKTIVGSGLYYLKGGDFTEELKAAGIAKSSLFPVKDLLPQLESDKNVLFVPATEILKFRTRHNHAA